MASQPDERAPAPEPRPRAPWFPVALAVFVAVVLAGVIGITVTTPPALPEPSSDELAAAVGSRAGDLLGTPVTTTPPTPGSIQFESVTTTTDPPPLPEAPPEDAYAPTPQIVLGEIEIPKLGVVAEIQEGITLTAINRGPGHWPGTPLPGGKGNMVIAGHRTTYSKPFADLDQLVPGDQVIFRMPTGTFVYEVRGVIIVGAANIGIAAQNSMHTATLFACHPKGSAEQRIVAKLKLLGADGVQVDPEPLLPPIDAGQDPVTGTTLLVREGTAAASGGDPLAGAEG